MDFDNRQGEAPTPSNGVKNATADILQLSPISPLAPITIPTAKWQSQSVFRSNAY
jgi:hypothetical protein